MPKLYDQKSQRAILTAALILSALPILAVVMFPAQLDRVMAKESYVTFHNIAEFFSIMVSCSIFGVGWSTYDRSGGKGLPVYACSMDMN